MGATHSVNAVQTAFGERIYFTLLSSISCKLLGMYVGHVGMNNGFEGGVAELADKSKVNTHHCEMKSVC